MSTNTTVLGRRSAAESTPTHSQAVLWTLLSLGQQLQQLPTPDDQLNLILEQVVALTSAEAVALIVRDDEQDRLCCVAATCPTTPPVSSGVATIPARHALSGVAHATLQPQTLAESGTHIRSIFDYLSSIIAESALSVPLMMLGDVIGVLELVNVDEPLSAEEHTIINTLAHHAANALQQKKLQQEVQEAKRELDDLDRFKNDFIAIASHELMTPLAIIIGHVSMLKEDVAEEFHEQMAHVMKAATRMRLLVHDLLNLRYVDAGQTELELSRFDIADFVRDTSAERANLFSANELSLQTRICKKSLPVIGDRRMLEVVLDILLKNAAKFTDAGGKVGIIAEEYHNEAWICIADTGVGIAEHDLKRVFNRFYQAEPHLRRKHEGLGLGLSIAKELIELHNGRIYAESTLGEGTRIHIRLPLVRA